jgi:hypothetical protein
LIIGAVLFGYLILLIHDSYEKDALSAWLGIMTRRSRWTETLTVEKTKKICG